jgi:transcriptional regulator with XRE-family HTH domain
MTQDTPSDDEVENWVRQRIRALRTARGWSLDELSRRTLIGASTLSRIETGNRRIALDQLAPIARALQTTIEELLNSPDDEVLIRPVRGKVRGKTIWPLSRNDSGVVVTKMRIPPLRGHVEMKIHAGREWFYVLSGTARLVLGDREILVEATQVAEFSTMTPHAIGGYEKAVELLSIFDHHGERAHLTP